MKVQCPNCNTAYNIDDKKIPDAGIYVKCKCGTKSFIKKDLGKSEGEPKIQEESKKDSEKCPKCGHIRQPNDFECPSCGIIYEKYKEKPKIQEESKTAEVLLKTDEVLKLKAELKKAEEALKSADGNKKTLKNIILSVTITVCVLFGTYFLLTFRPVKTVQPEPVITVQPEPVITVQPEPVKTVQPEPVKTAKTELYSGCYICKDINGVSIMTDSPKNSYTDCVWHFKSVNTYNEAVDRANRARQEADNAVWDNLNHSKPFNLNQSQQRKAEESSRKKEEVAKINKRREAQASAPSKKEYKEKYVPAEIHIREIKRRLFRNDRYLP